MSILAFNPACMAAMSTAHLIASLEAQSSPLTSTAAEAELIRRLEDAIDQLDEKLDASDVTDAVVEAVAQYPAEDFLDQIIDRINELSKRLRGANAEELKRISESLFDISENTTRAAEYGAEKLNNLIKDL